MERREMLWAFGAAAAAPIAMIAQQAPHVHGTPDHQALIAASSNCVVKGEACLAHCQQMLADGDKSMAQCPRTGSEMVTLCGALRTLAAQDAPSLPKLAAVAMDACGRCESHCRKFANVQQHCRECADACAACAAECRKIAKA